MADATDLDTLAHAILDASADALDTLTAFGLEGAPTRRFCVPYTAMLDCCDDGQLTVQTVLITPGPTTPGGLDAGKRFLRGQINHVTFLITIARCVAVVGDNRGAPPTADEQNTAAEQTNADAWCLFNHIFDIAASLVSLCGEVFFDGMRPLPASMCAGWVLTLRVRLDGYQEP